MTSESLILISLRSLLAFTKIYKRISDYNHLRTRLKDSGAHLTSIEVRVNGLVNIIYSQPNYTTLLCWFVEDYITCMQ